MKIIKPFNSGRVPCLSPPRIAPALWRWCCITFSELSLQGECHSGGGGGITCRSPKKSVKKNILRISHENCTIPVNIGKCQSRSAMTYASSEEMPPRRFNYLKNSAPGLPGACYGCQWSFHNFSWFGETHSRSCPFLLSRIYPDPTFFYSH